MLKFNRIIAFFRRNSLDTELAEEIIGVRIALGARRRDAVAFIVRRVLTPVAIGTAAGLVITSQAARLLATQLYGVSPMDPPAFVTSVLFVTGAAAVAAWLPARRAASVDPVLALPSDR